MRTARLNLRVDEATEALVREAAEASATTISAFIETAAVSAAQRQLAEQSTFTLSPEQWDAFVRELERPARQRPGLARAITRHRRTRPQRP